MARKPCDCVDLVIFARFLFSRISLRGHIREFKNLAKNVIIIALLKKNKKSRTLNFVKSPKIRNSRKFKHGKITRSTVYIYICFRSIEISLDLIIKYFGRWEGNLIIQYYWSIFFHKYKYFRHLKLEIALAIPASNKWKTETDNSVWVYYIYHIPWPYTTDICHWLVIDLIS